VTDNISQARRTAQRLAPEDLSGEAWGSPAALIADGKTLANRGRTLDFVGRRNGKILKGDRAFSVGSRQKLVGAEPELAGPHPGGEQRRGRDEGPVQVFLPGEPEVLTAQRRYDAQHKAIAA
jgi:hypothetical protein